MMRWVAITLKAGRELVRDRMALFFSLLFPVIFILLFGIVFGTFTEGNTTYNLAIINFDEGLEVNSTPVNHSQTLIDIFTTMKYQDEKGENTSTKVFKVRTDLTESEAQDLVEDRDIDAYIVIPHNFSSAVMAESMRYIQSAISLAVQQQFEALNSDGVNQTAQYQLFVQIMSNITGPGGELAIDVPEYDRNATAIISIQGDPSRQSYFTVSGIVEGVLRAYVEEVGIRTLEFVEQTLPIKIDPSAQRPRVLLENKAYESSEFSAFDYMVPGLVIFALLMSAMGVTISLAKEESRGTLTRLKLTKMNSFDMLFGTTIPFTVLALVQMLILIGLALFMGYHYNPDANIGLAIIITLFGALASVALGLILASMAKNEDQAGNIAPAVCVPLSFLTGAFFPMPVVILTDNFLGTGRSFELFDWLPWTQCSKGLAKVLTFGATFDDVALDIGLMAVFTTIFFIAGVILYHKRRIKNI